MTCYGSRLYYDLYMDIRRVNSAGNIAVLRTQIKQYFTLTEFRKGLSLRVAYMALQLADCLMTVFAVNSGFEEINPVMRGLLGSPLQLVTFKLVIPLAIAWLVPAKLLLPALVLLLAIIGLNVKELIVFLY
jgi:hypothetical protein